MLRDSGDSFNILGNFYDEDYDDEYDYDDNYIDGVYGNKKEFSSSENKKVIYFCHLRVDVDHRVWTRCKMFCLTSIRRASNGLVLYN